MLSSQINFFALPEDFPNILQWLKEREIVFLNTYHLDPGSYVINFLNTLFLTNCGQIALTLSKWVKSIEYEKILRNDNTIIYSMDYDKELVIEFSSGYIGMYDLLPITRFYLQNNIMTVRLRHLSRKMRNI